MMVSQVLAIERGWLVVIIVTCLLLLLAHLLGSIHEKRKRAQHSFPSWPAYQALYLNASGSQRLH